MTLELNKVTHQVAQLGEHAARRQQLAREAVPEILRLLRTYATDAALRELVTAAIKASWTGGIPFGEPIDAAIDPRPLPERFTVVAADGSQVYPDRHGIALYYAINIGSIVLRFGTGEVPLAESEPVICFEAAQLSDDFGNLVSSQLINARRALQEIMRLAARACTEIQLAPTVALSDGNLALRVKQEGIPEREGQQLQADYIAQLDWLRESNVCLGSFISRPSSTSIVRLIDLAERTTLDRVSEYVKNKPRPFDDLTDTPVFARHLQPGQRSAVFRQVTQWSKPYEDAGHAIHFFYVNVSVPGQHTLVRVELPEWVAARPVQVELLHAAIVDQCRVTGFPYPYALTRADELAVVTTVEKASLERMIAIEMMQHDVEARPSEKAATKSIARYGKHR